MATKFVYVQGFGVVEVPSELQGDDLVRYANQEADRMSAPTAPAVKEEKKPDVPLYKQTGAAIASIPGGFVSGLVGTPLEGIGGLTGIKALEEAGVDINKWVEERTKDIIGEELAGTTGAQAGRTIGGIASFFTPGIAAKVIGATGKVAKGLSLGASALQGAGEQVERMREQEAQGQEISAPKRALYSALAGAGTAALEALPIEKLAEMTPLARALGRFPVKSIEAENLAKAYDMSLGRVAGEALKSGLTEAPIEAGQEALQNVIEKYGYNPERSVMENVGQAALVGGIAGGVLQGGIDLYTGARLNRTLNKQRAEAERLKSQPVQIPTDVEETTAFITPEGVTTVEGRIEREARVSEAKKSEEEAAGIAALQEQITSASNPEVKQLAAAAGAHSPEDYAKLEELKAEQEQSNALAKQEYEKQVAQKKQEDLLFVKSNPELANEVAKLVGYRSRLQVKSEDLPVLADTMRWHTSEKVKRAEEFDNAEIQKLLLEEFQQKKAAALPVIDENFSLASGISRKELGKPLGLTTDQDKIDLAEMVSAEKLRLQEQANSAKEEADYQTKINQEIPQIGDDAEKRTRRASSNLFGTPNWERLPQEQYRTVLEQANKEPGTKVTPEQVLEEREFSDKPYNTDGFRSVLSTLRASKIDETGMIPVDERKMFSAIKTARLDPRTAGESLVRSREAAETMYRHMVDRGNLVEIDGKAYLNEGQRLPMYEESPSTATVTPEAEQQFKFNEKFIKEEIEPKIAPPIREAIKRRNVEDLFLVGLSGKVGPGKDRGSYLDRVIRVAVAPDGNVRTLEDMQGTVDHEIIHGMRRLGLFSDAEWNVLTSKFNVNTMDERRRKSYEERYKGRPGYKDLITEEAVADAARNASTAGPQRLDPASLSLKNKVSFYLDFGRKSAALGYRTADDILSAIKSGEIGKRRFSPAFEQVSGKTQRVQAREISPRISVAKPQASAPPSPTETGADGILPPSTVTPPTEEAKAKPAESAVPTNTSVAETEVSALSSATQADPMTRVDEPGKSKFFTQSTQKSLLDRTTDSLKKGVFRQKMIDRYDPARVNAIRAYDQQMKKYRETGAESYRIEAEKRLSASQGAYHALLFADKAQDVALAWLEYGGGEVKNGIIQATEGNRRSPLEIFRGLSEKGKLESFFDAAYAERYMDLKRENKDPGGLFSEQEVKAEQDKYSGDEDIRRALDDFKGYTDNLADVMKKSGVISVAQAEAWKSAYYIPFYRIPTMTDVSTGADTGEVDWPTLTNQVTNLSGIKSLSGRKLGVNDAMENIIANTYYIIGNAAKNIAAQKVARDGLETNYMQEVSKPSEAPEKDSVITVLDKGERRYFYVTDPLLYDAVAKSGFPVQDILKGMGWFTQALRKGVTISPTFIIRNAVRDTVQVWMQGGYGKDFTPPISELMDGISLVANNSPEYQALKKAGIAGSGLRERTIKETAAAVRREIGQGQENALMKVYDYLSKLADKSESITRAKVYKDVLDKTGDQAEALFAAMETINFSRKGSSRGLQIGMALIPFFNARIQGMDVFYRTVRGDSIMPSQMGVQAKKNAMTRMTYVFGLSMLYAMMMANHPAWENATEEEKDSNLFIPIPFAEELGIKEGTAIKFPIPQEIGIVTKMFPERLISYLMGKTDFADNIDAIQRTVFETLSFNPIPQVFLPALEASGNFDYYTQRNIENEYLRSLLPEERYTEYTTGVAKAAGQLTGTSPTKIDHLIRGYFGTMGAYTADVIGQILDQGQSVPKPERLRFSEPYLAPVIGPLFKSPDGRKFAEELYEINQAASMAVSTLKSYTKGQRDIPEDKVDELRELASVSKQIRPILSRVQALNSMKRSIQADPGMTSAEKRDELNEIQQQIISLAKEAQEFKKEIPFRLR